MKDKKTFNSIAIIVGTAIGAGIFGLPYAISKAGYLVGLFYLIGLGIVSVILLMAYGEVVLRTREKYQIIGYTKHYLGNNWRMVGVVSFLFGITGALIAYTIGVGEFLYSLIGQYFGGSAYAYSLIYFIVVSLIVLAGLGMVLKFEGYLILALIIIVGLIIVAGLPKLSLDNLLVFNPKFLFLPYGVVLFALSAASAIPDATHELADKKKLYRVVKIGMIVPLIIYILFSTVIVGVCGASTHEGAILGLKPYIGNWILTIGALFGVLTMTTSFLALGLVIKDIYRIDFRLPKFWAWLIAMTPPLLIFLFKLTNFVSVISLVGGVMGGFDGIIILLMWRKARKFGNRKPECQINIAQWFQYFMILIFSAGIIYEIYYQIFQ
ncbi:MAG: aromatic amino acid transport family protein [Patescibacteria group bacterium]|nr:aromatic amino acid transport family protein [Patescibacteria group bacterium]